MKLRDMKMETERWVKGRVNYLLVMYGLPVGPQSSPIHHPPLPPSLSITCVLSPLRFPPTTAGGPVSSGVSHSSEGKPDQVRL